MSEGREFEPQMTFGQEMIDDSLKTMKVPRDISLDTLADLIRQAPEGAKFTVTNSQQSEENPPEQKQTYAKHFTLEAKKLDRNDVTFVGQQT